MLNDIPVHLKRELATIQSLPKDHGSPVADTYNRLQGIPFLKHLQSLVKKSTIETHLYITIYQCIALSHFNIDYLFQSKNNQNSITVLSNKLRWSRAILDINQSLIKTAETLEPYVDKTIFGAKLNTSWVYANESFNKLNTKIVEKLLHNEAKLNKSIVSGYLMDDLSVYVHEAKCIGHLLFLENNYFKNHIQEKFIGFPTAYYACHAIKTSTPNYLMQFRLFHQIPELLSIFINESLDRKKLMSNSEYEFNKSVKLSNMAMNHIIECVHPLATLMYPSEYYSIRRNLGETSGSMSKSLNVTMSKNALFLKDLISNNSVSIAHQIKFEANIYLMLARKWRDIHIMLPKHILGSGAASLMGNENAILEASNLNDRFINKITENSKYKMLEYMGKNDGHSGVEHLISLTGNLTRHEFSNVEQRAKLGRKHGRKKN